MEDDVLMLPGRLLKHTDEISVFSDDVIEHTDIYGDVVYEDLPPVTIEGCVVVPATMDELYEPGRSWTLSGYDVYAPITSSHLIDSTSRVRWDNKMWEVEGEARRWKNPYTGTAYVRFRIERAGTDPYMGDVDAG